MRHLIQFLGEYIRSLWTSWSSPYRPQPEILVVTIIFGVCSFTLVIFIIMTVLVSSLTYCSLEWMQQVTFFSIQQQQSGRSLETISLFQYFNLVALPGCVCYGWGSQDLVPRSTSRNLGVLRVLDTERALPPSFIKWPDSPLISTTIIALRYLP